MSPEREDAGPGAGAERGRLIALEGIDGCGQVDPGRARWPTPRRTRHVEPGATALGRELRRLTSRPDPTTLPSPEPRPC